MRVNLPRGDKKWKNTESSSRKRVDHRRGLRSNEGLSEGDKVKGEGYRETDQECWKRNSRDGGEGYSSENRLEGRRQQEK